MSIDTIVCWCRPAGYTSITVFLMHDILVDQIKLLPLPDDLTSANRSWLSTDKLNPDSVSHPAFIALLDQFVADSQGNRKGPHLSTLRSHWELILLNLSQAVFKRRWPMVALNRRTQGPSVKQWLAPSWQNAAIHHRLSRQPL